MLTRLYIDNFRCFEGFEYRPGKKQLILGANGSGKSSLVDAIVRLRAFVAGDAKVNEAFPGSQRTRWKNQAEQTFEIEAQINGFAYQYKLGVSEDADGPRVLESLRQDGKAILVSDGTWARVPSASRGDTAYPTSGYRSAIATFPRGVLVEKATVRCFRDWLAAVQCFRIDPFSMSARTEKEDEEPEGNLSNFASWYRHVSAALPDKASALNADLRESIDGFNELSLEDAGAGVELLTAEFEIADRSEVRFRFNELSEGQRCLIALYAIVHFVIASGLTAFIDEPENFIGLREMQPWLLSLSDAIEDFGGQAILVSHHPEFLDQWAAGFGQRFVRDGAGPVRIAELASSGIMTPSELVARGWDDA